MRLVRVPLRISFIGGGSDIPAFSDAYGGAVVSTTIDKYIYITAKPNVSLFPHKYRLVYSKVEECNHVDEIQHPIIRQLVKDYRLDSLDLDVMSDIPSGTGMGSSSAFTVGLHAALSPLELTKKQLALLACNTELVDLKEPIGKQDQYAAAFGGLNKIEFRRDETGVERLAISAQELRRLQGALTLVYIGGQRSASSVLATQDLEHQTEILKELALRARILGSRVQPAIYEFGLALDYGWQLKKKLSQVSTPLVDRIIDTAVQAGAMGGKLLGAGQSGFILLYCRPESQAEMMDALAPLNLQYVRFAFESKGCQVLYED